MMTQKIATLGLAGMLLLGLSPAAQAATYTLFDPATGRSPSQQGWFSSLPAEVSQSFVSGKLVLDSSGKNTYQAGYAKFRPWNLAIPLNRTAGYTLSLEVQLPIEEHASNDRAGFSTILVSSDRQAIELDFWKNRIWAQRDAVDGGLFTQGEGVNIDTASVMRRYDVVVVSDRYCLFANGQLALRGRLRNYSSFGFPYSQPSLIFLGDNTQSARAKLHLGKVTLQDSAIASCPAI
ncbi:MAG: hypothetical protein HC860_08000 [Alkalinema sp. RU_4_3]|nr:hypothetical protein [Alkalinema sp. RU_4_3]